MTTVQNWSHLITCVDKGTNATVCLTTQETIFQFQRIAETFQQFSESTFSSLSESTHFCTKFHSQSFSNLLQQFTESVCVKCACRIGCNIHLNRGCCRNAGFLSTKRWNCVHFECIRQRQEHSS